MQTDPKPETMFAFSVDYADLEVPLSLTCRMADLPTHLLKTLSKLPGLSIGQAPMMIEIRRVD